jgi:hypothetical protein
VLAAPLRIARDERPGAAPGQQRPGAGQPGVAQHVSGGVAEPGQVIERLFRDLVVAVGLADGEGQPEHEAGSPPPRRGQAALGGHGDRGLPQAVVAGQAAVLDAAGMGVGELPAGPEQQELPGDGRRADPRVIAGSAEAMRSWSSQDRGRVRSGARPWCGLSMGWALGGRSPGRISMSCDGRPPDGRAIHSGSRRRMFSRQSRHSPSALTWLSCPHLRHGATSGCRCRQEEQAPQSAN